jgi:hypothetical protein
MSTFESHRQHLTVEWQPLPDKRGDTNMVGDRLHVFDGHEWKPAPHPKPKAFCRSAAWVGKYVADLIKHDSPTIDRVFQLSKQAASYALDVIGRE